MPEICLRSLPNRVLVLCSFIGLADAVWVGLWCLYIPQADIWETQRTLWGNVFISFCCIISLMSPDRLTESFSEGFSSALCSCYFRLYIDSQWEGFVGISERKTLLLLSASLIDSWSEINQLPVSLDCEHAGFSHVYSLRDFKRPPLTH